MNKRLYGIRGATSVENSENSIIENVGKMCSAIFAQNGIKAGDIVSIFFTMTGDIDALNACTALRRSDCGIDVSKCALFAAEEPVVKNSMPLMIRVLVTAYLDEGSEVKHVYLGRAAQLRPDFAEKGKA